MYARTCPYTYTHIHTYTYIEYIINRDDISEIKIILHEIQIKNIEYNFSIQDFVFEKVNLKKNPLYICASN